MFTRITSASSCLLYRGAQHWASTPGLSHQGWVEGKSHLHQSAGQTLSNGPWRLLTLTPGPQITWCHWRAQVQDFTFPFAVIYEILVCPFLHPDKVPVKSNTIFWSTSHFSAHVLKVDSVSSCSRYLRCWTTVVPAPLWHTPSTVVFLAPFLHGSALSLFSSWITSPCFYLLYAFFPCVNFVKSCLIISADLLPLLFGFIHIGMDCS